MIGVNQKMHSGRFKSPYILGESDDHFLGGRINYDHHKLNMVRAIAAIKRYSYLAPMILKAKGDDLDMHSLRILMSDLSVINKDINPIYGQQTTFHTTARGSLVIPRLSGWAT